MSAKIAPEESEVSVRPETPPPGWVDDEDAGPPQLKESENEDFLAASRARRAQAIAQKGKRRYNIALRIVGAICILNMLTCIIPLIDGVYTLSWATISAGLVKYSMNHFSIVDSEGGNGAQSFAPYEHYKAMYEKYDTSFDGEVSFVLLQPNSVSSKRSEYCKLVLKTFKYAIANNDKPSDDPWCDKSIEVAYAFLCLELFFALMAVILWYLLLKGDGDIPPSRKIEYSPPDTDNPKGKFYILTVYHACIIHLICGSCGAVSLDVWNRYFINKYATTNCGSNVCPNIGKDYYITLVTTVISFMISLYYRAIGRQNYLYTLRKFINAAKTGNTFEILKISGQSWFLRYIDELDPDGSGKNALHWASRKGSSTMAQILVQSGADPRIRDTSGWNAMHYAARYGHSQVLKNLLGSKYGEILVHQREALGAYPLHMCAASGNLDCAITLINSSGQPNINSVNAFGQTPLMLASGRAGKGAAIIDMLITSGASPTMLDEYGSSALHYAASTGSTYSVERLIRATYRSSLAPLGGRKKPAITLQAKHNKWNETAADEAYARNRKSCKDMLLANIDLYNIDDNERLKTSTKPLSQSSSSSSQFKSSKQFISTLNAFNDKDFDEFDLDEEDEYANYDEELGGFEISGGSYQYGSSNHHKDNGRRSSSRLFQNSSGSTENQTQVDHIEEDYPSDDERNHNDAAILDSVLRRRLSNG